METLKRRNFLGRIAAISGGSLIFPGMAIAGNGKETEDNIEPGIKTPPETNSVSPDAFSIIITLKKQRIIAFSDEKKIISEGVAGKDDAVVFQQAIDSLGKKGGSIRIKRGRYRLSESVIIDYPVSVTGEGQGTIIVPPQDDYAFRVITTKRSPVRPNSGKLPGGRPGDDTLSGVTMELLTIDGEGAGKGI